MSKRRRQRHDDDHCAADSFAKCRPYLMALAHFHDMHSGHAGSYTGFYAARDILEFPDVYVVSDPKTRAKFREFAATIRAGESAAVVELHRMMGLAGPGPTLPDPAREKTGPEKRRAASA